MVLKMNHARNVHTSNLHKCIQRMPNEWRVCEIYIYIWYMHRSLIDSFSATSKIWILFRPRFHGDGQQVSNDNDSIHNQWLTILFNKMTNLNQSSNLEPYFELTHSEMTSKVLFMPSAFNAFEKSFQRFSIHPDVYNMLYECISLPTALFLMCIIIIYVVKFNFFDPLHLFSDLCLVYYYYYYVPTYVYK